MNDNTKNPFPKRKTTAHGVRFDKSDLIVVFVTVCTKDRKKWLNTPEYHDLLRNIWTDASAWLVGKYIIMPDHIHLFTAPTETNLPLDNWVRYWKSMFSKSIQNKEHKWQSGHWDTQLRDWESYEAKWEYVINNSVRHKLVIKPEDWPYQGEIHSLEWY